MNALIFIVVRVTGVEPARLAALDPKSSASANFATPAQKELYLFFQKVSILFQNIIFFSFLRSKLSLNQQLKVLKQSIYTV